MNNHQPPPTAPGFTSFPLAPQPTDSASAPLRRAWSVRRRAAAAIAVLALAGTGGAVATGGLSGSDGNGVDTVTPPAAPEQPGGTTPSRQRERGDSQSGNDESDEA